MRMDRTPQKVSSAERLYFKRQVTIVLVLLFWGLAAILMHRFWNPALERFVPSFPFFFLVLIICAFKIAERAAIFRYGEIEAKEQAAETQQRHRKLDKLVASDGYKRRAYRKNVTGFLIVALLPVCFGVAAIAIQLYQTSPWSTLNVALVAAVLLAFAIGKKIEKKKFGDE
jgi:hypothetical protein